MKILVTGDWHSKIHEETVYSAFGKLGHDVYKFSWHQYFKSNSQLKFVTLIEKLNKKLQNKFITGPIVEKINSDLITFVFEIRPDLLFLYRSTHITYHTLSIIKSKQPSVSIVGYNNDNPFSPKHPFWLWRHFLQSIPQYDLIFSYRKSNIEEYIKAGAKRVDLLPPWYVPEINHPVILTEKERKKFECDVVFVGHYEPDDRAEYLETVEKNGFKLNLFGPEWNRVIKHHKILSRYYPVEYVYGEDYNKSLCGAKIALCFLSKLNLDTYTRRCFEIPATKTFLLSEYTDDLAKLFKEGVEAEYFRDKDEMIEKIKLYINNDDLRKSVALAGYNHVLNDGHDVVSRMKQVLEWVTNIKKK